MLPRNWKSLGVTLATLFGLAVFLSATAAPPRLQSSPPVSQEILLTLDPANTKLHWTVDSTLHTVHGTFAVKSGTMHFDPESGKAGGEIIIFATSGQSGNSARDEKMHKVVLESAKYPDVVFRPTQIEGKVASPGNSDVKLHGIFTLHGTDHDLVVPVHTELKGNQWSGTAKFDVPYTQWGLKDPSNFLLKVKPLVSVELEMTGTSKTNN